MALLKFVAMASAEKKFAIHLVKRAKSSFQYYHPDIPFFIFIPGDEQKIFGNTIKFPKGILSSNVRLRFLNYLMKDYDVVLWFDVDIVIVSRLDEFLDVDYDVAGSFNVERRPGDDYMNTGVCSIANKEFARKWLKLCCDKNFLEEHKFGMEKQDVFNFLSKRYKLKVVDKEGVYYNERSRPYWGDIIVKDGKLFCNNRQLKVLHWAGGPEALADKLSCKRFNKETREFLNKVTNTADFTEIEGVEKWY